MQHEISSWAYRKYYFLFFFCCFILLNLFFLFLNFFHIWLTIHFTNFSSPLFYRMCVSVCLWVFVSLFLNSLIYIIFYFFCLLYIAFLIHWQIPFKIYVFFWILFSYCSSILIQLSKIKIQFFLLLFKFQFSIRNQ